MITILVYRAETTKLRRLINGPLNVKLSDGQAFINLPVAVLYIFENVDNLLKNRQTFARQKQFIKYHKNVSSQSCNNYDSSWTFLLFNYPKTQNEESLKIIVFIKYHSVVSASQTLNITSTIIRILSPSQNKNIHTLKISETTDSVGTAQNAS